jgi:putative intracellular protease/amidase
MSKGICVIAVDHGYESLDLFIPRLRFLETQAFTVKHAGPEKKKQYFSKQGQFFMQKSLLESQSIERRPEMKDRASAMMDIEFKNLYVESDISYDEIPNKDVKLLIVPGGLMSPDNMRTCPKLLELVRNVYKSGAYVCFIGHGSWVAVSSGIAKGKKLTGFPSLKDDINNSQAHWTDERVVHDERIISCQDTRDLPELFKLLSSVMKIHL